jgi:hypothetical protein
MASPKAVEVSEPVFAVQVELPIWIVPGFALRIFENAAPLILTRAITSPTTVVVGKVSVNKEPLLQKYPLFVAAV